MQLMNGFYHNIEDGLFELAYSNQDQHQQRRVVELMRELRFRRKQLIKTFGRRLHNASRDWLMATSDEDGTEDERTLADQMAAKCSSHFGPLLQTIAERASSAANRSVARRQLPASPEQISYHFVMSCRSVEFDKHTIGAVQTLFGRFVLDRLGAVYGRINTDLEEAGYWTSAEHAEVEAAHMTSSA